MTEQLLTFDADDRRAARLALRLAEPPARPDEPGEEPSDEHIAALIDGRLDGAERERVLALLDRDPLARRRWLAAAAQVAHADAHRKRGQETRATAAPLASAAAAPRARAHARPARFRRAALGMALAAGLAALALLQPFAPLAPGVSQRIGTELAALRGGVGPVPALESGYGFAESAAPEGLAAALASGYRAGRGELAGAPPGSPGSPAAAFDLGRWIALVEAGAHADAAPPPRFWSDQGEIATRLVDELGRSDAGAESVRTALAAVRKRLERPPAAPDARWRRDLGAEILVLRQRLGLREAPGKPPRTP